MDIEKLTCRSKGWNKLTQNILLWQALVKPAISFRVTSKAESSFSCPN
jgi:hypothetical protein